MIFVSGAIIEYAVLLHIKRWSQKGMENKVNAKEETNKALNVKKDNQSEQGPLQNKETQVGSGVVDFKRRVRLIDYSALFVYLSAFFVFNTSYWRCYL